MVWIFSYRPQPDSGPDAEVVEGNLKHLGRGGEHLELEDYTPDGGGGLQVGHFEGESGRRVKPESVPKVVRWKSRRPLLDYETVFCKTVSDRFRNLIEQIEPGVHQFEPIEFIARDRSALSKRWFWQICNRLDTVHPAKTDMVMGNLIWRRNDSIPKDQRIGAVFDIRKIGNAKFWYDKHLSGGPYCSDDAKDCISSAGMTGIHFDPRKSA